MDTSPISALSRSYTLGFPKRSILDSGVAAMQLGNGVLRTREELGQAIVAYDCRLDGLTADDKEIIEDFYTDHRAETFYWSHPKTYLTYESRFDPESPPQVTPMPGVLDHYIAELRILPVVPTTAVDMLVAHWKMNDDAADTDVLDASGNSYTLTAQQNSEDLTVAGKITDALAFNGSSDYLSCSATGFDSASGTWMAWVKPTTVAGSGTIIASCDEATGSRLLRLHRNGSAVNYMAVGSGFSDNLSTASVFTAGQWSHVALASDGTTVMGYVDGLAVAFGTVHAGANSGRWLADVADRDNVTVGVRKDTGLSDYFSGVIDDVRIYKRALTGTEIAAIYNSGSGTESEVVA